MKTRLNFLTLVSVILLVSCFLLYSSSYLASAASSKSSLYLSGLQALNDGNLDLATQKFNDDLKNSTETSSALLQLAMISLYKDDLVNCKNYLRKANAAVSSLGPVVQLQIDFVNAFLAEETEEQQRILKDLLAQENKDFVPEIYTAMHNYSLNKHHMAVRQLKPKAEIFSFPVYYWLSRSMFDMGDFDNAIKYSVALLDKTPDFKPILQILSGSYLNQGNYEKSFSIYIKILDQEPGNLSAHCGCGKSLLYTNQPNKALEHFKYIMNALDQNRLNWKCYWNIATCYTYLGQNENAFNVLNNFMAKCEKSNNPMMYAVVNHKLAQFYYLCGEYDLAKQQFDNWIKWVIESDFNTNYQLNQQARYYCEMFQLSIMKNDLQEFNSFMKEYQKLVDDNQPSIRICEKVKGLDAFQKGDYAKALESFDTLQESCEKWFWTSVFYKAMKKDKDADLYYQKILDQKPNNFNTVLYQQLAMKNKDIL